VLYLWTLGSIIYISTEPSEACQLITLEKKMELQFLLALFAFIFVIPHARANAVLMVDEAEQFANLEVQDWPNSKERPNFKDNDGKLLFDLLNVPESENHGIRFKGSVRKSVSKQLRQDRPAEGHEICSYEWELSKLRSRFRPL
jgi:hypothetical protein